MYKGACRKCFAFKRLSSDHLGVLNWTAFFKLGTVKIQNYLEGYLNALIFGDCCHTNISCDRSKEVLREFLGINNYSHIIYKGSQTLDQASTRD